MHQKLQDFKSVITTSQLKLCGEKVTNEDKLEKNVLNFSRSECAPEVAISWKGFLRNILNWSHSLKRMKQHTNSRTERNMIVDERIFGIMVTINLITKE